MRELNETAEEMLLEALGGDCDLLEAWSDAARAASIAARRAKAKGKDWRKAGRRAWDQTYDPKTKRSEGLSTKAIKSAFPELSDTQVHRVRRISMQPGYDARLDGSRSLRHPAQDRMDRINAVVKGYGVEYIPRGHNEKSPSITYVNRGDPYTPTIMKVGRGHRSLGPKWRKLTVGKWGDRVERGRYD